MKEILKWFLSTDERRKSARFQPASRVENCKPPDKTIEVLSTNYSCIRYSSLYLKTPYRSIIMQLQGITIFCLKVLRRRVLWKRYI